MGRKSNKSKEKKLRRKEENAKLASAQRKVDIANKQKDPLENLKAFKRFDRNCLSIGISCCKHADLDKSTAEWVFQITQTNMKSLYEESDWGWDEQQKRDELCEEAAWYLIARDDYNTPVACVHFRFDIDNEDEVLYCYEIQLEECVRRKGLGKFLMQILELMAYRTEMIKVMLTIFKHNPAAVSFFLSKLKYTVDETSPEDTVIDAMFGEEGEQIYSYQIISKMIPQKKIPKESRVDTIANGQSITAT